MPILEQAIAGRATPALRLLPDAVAALLVELDAPPLLTASTGGAAWEAFLDLDEVLARLAEQADARLAFQAGFPVRAS